MNGNELQYIGIDLKSLCIQTLRQWRRILVAAVMGALLLGAYSVVTYQPPQPVDWTVYEKDLKRIDEYETVIRELKDLIGQAQEGYADCEAAVKEAKGLLDETTTDVERVQVLAAIGELQSSMMNFTERQSAWRQLIVLLTEEIETIKETLPEEVPESELSAESMTAVVPVVKNAVLGALMGAVLVCAILAVLGCFDHRLHARGEMEAAGVPVLGELAVPVPGKRSKLDLLLDKWEGRPAASENEKRYDLMAANLRVALKQGTIVVTGTQNGDRETAEALAERLPAEQYRVEFSANPLCDADALLNVGEKHVLLVEHRGVSDMREVVKLVQLLRADHMALLGAVIR